MENLQIFKTIKTFVHIIGAIIVLIFAKTFVEADYLRYVVGTSIIYFALERIAQAFLSTSTKSVLEEHKFFQGIVELIIGLGVLLLYEDYNTVCIIWGVWAITREAYELEEAFNLFREKIPAVLLLALSVCAITFSVLLILEPGEHHALMHMYLLVAELYSVVLLPQLRYLYLRFVRH